MLVWLPDPAHLGSPGSEGRYGWPLAVRVALKYARLAAEGDEGP